MKPERGQGYLSWTDWNFVGIVPSLCGWVLIGLSWLSPEGLTLNPDKSSTVPIHFIFEFKISSHCWNVYSNYKLKCKSVQKAQKGQALTTGLARLNI